MNKPILHLKDLKKYFTLRRGPAFWKTPSLVKAVDGISFEINQGETFGLVGESGCGKSTTGKVILKILQASSGEIWFKGQNTTGLKGKDLQGFRRNIQAVYQDPYASLNPRMRVDRIIGEPLTAHKHLAKKAWEQKIVELLEKTGLLADHAHRYPHEFSGGQRQRICIARALALNPSFLVLDEPVSALDMSIRSQILNLLQNLQEEFQLTYLFISHDLSVIEHICDHIAVMYLGKIVEQATKDKLFIAPRHPYTEALLSSVPVADPDYSFDPISLTGEIPSPLNPPPGCRFHPRCPRRMEICDREAPGMVTIETDHKVGCHLFE
jgi:oligopeptide/dipeptide ABC transporter ATP-binding protein